MGEARRVDLTEGGELDGYYVTISALKATNPSIEPKVKRSRMSALPQ